MLEGLTPPVRQKGKCKAQRLIDSLEPKDADLLQSFLDDPAWVAETLSRSLRERGVMLGAKTIREHRESRCFCERSNG